VTTDGDDGVLILSSLSEPCTQWVIKELDKSGCEHQLVNYEEAVLGHSWSIALDPGHAKAEVQITRSGNSGARAGVGQLRPRSVWMRRWGHPIYPASFDNLSLAFSFGEISSVVAALSEVFPGARWMNHQASERRASNKVYQLDLARALGLPIPKTLVTNDPERVREFAASVPRAIFKPVSAYHPQHRRLDAGARAKLGPSHAGVKLGFGHEANGFLVFTQELTPERMDKLDSLPWAPAIFQERVDKRSDIRVTIVGSRIFSCRIDSQSRRETETDFRVMNLTGAVRHELISLPAQLEHTIHNYMAQLGLTFGCMDLVENKDGEYCFLEVNPVGQWLWIEQLTGAPISRAVADALITGAAAEPEVGRR
jgi:hypothetical protein